MGTGIYIEKFAEPDGGVGSGAAALTNSHTSMELLSTHTQTLLSLVSL